MSFHGNGFIVIGIDSVVSAFSENVKPIVLHLFDKISREGIIPRSLNKEGFLITGKCFSSLIESFIR